MPSTRDWALDIPRRPHGYALAGSSPCEYQGRPLSSEGHSLGRGAGCRRMGSRIVLLNDRQTIGGYPPTCWGR